MLPYAMTYAVKSLDSPREVYRVQGAPRVFAALRGDFRPVVSVIAGRHAARDLQPRVRI
jgi:hypothetical protein